MRTYKLHAVVRPDDRPGPEAMAEIVVRARTEPIARRIALEAAWENDMLITRFLAVMLERFN